MKKKWFSSFSFSIVGFGAWLSDMPAWMWKHRAECTSIMRISNMCWNLAELEN